MKDVNKFVEERKKCSNTVRHILISKRKKLKGINIFVSVPTKLVT